MFFQFLSVMNVVILVILLSAVQRVVEFRVLKRDVISCHYNTEKYRQT